MNVFSRAAWLALSGGFALACAAPAAAATDAGLPAGAPVHHVLLVSVDGLHGSDLAHYIAAHPSSELARLARRGIDYTAARTVEPADSFPGLAALVTGGTPAETGIYYDVSYDRTLAAPGSDCTHPGTRVPFDESLDRRDAAGNIAIDPARLPRDPAHGCAPVWPHAYLRVNTIFEAVRDAGGYSAWIDKHPAYEFVEGPSGHGVNDLFLPEIGANFEKLAPDAAQPGGITGSLARTEAYDAMKAKAIGNEIAERTHDGAAAAPVPNVFGLNFQSVNVAQKLYGYRDASGALTPGVDAAIGHVDRLLAGFDAALRRRGLLDDTLLVVTAKHGNGPIDPARLHRIDTAKLQAAIEQAAPGALAQLTPDHGALVWLNDASATPKVVAALQAQAQRLGIAEVLSGDALAQRLGTQPGDPRVPDCVVVTRDGVIYTQPGDGKLAEHGGFHDDDTQVALLVSSPRLAGPGERVSTPVSVASVAPTVLASLGLDPARLQAVAERHTAPLPGLHWRAAEHDAHDTHDVHRTGKPS
ncbi:MAG: alkaline phosphatase family protein [Burkholderia sp.]